MSLRVEVASQAARAIRKLQRTEQRRILDALDDIAGDPRPPGKHVKAITGGPQRLLRYRVRDLRILYEVIDMSDVVLIHAVVARRDLEDWIRRQR